MNKEQFINELIEKLYQKTGRKPLIKESERLNEDGQDILVIRGEKSDMQVRIELLWNAYESGKTKEELCREIIFKLSEFDKSRNEVTPLIVGKWEEVSPRVRCKVYSKERNLNNIRKRHIPYYVFLDLVVTFYLQIDEEDEVTIDITEEYLNRWNISKENLLEAVEENMKEITYECIGFEKHVKQILGIQEENKDDSVIHIGPEPMYILSKKGGLHGAAAILNTEVLENVYATVRHNDFFILPSSVNELIIVPDYSYYGYDIQMLQFIVMETNMDCVNLEDQLSNSVYYYKHETRLVTKLA